MQKIYIHIHRGPLHGIDKSKIALIQANESAKALQKSDNVARGNQVCVSVGGYVRVCVCL